MRCRTSTAAGDCWFYRNRPMHSKGACVYGQIYWYWDFYKWKHERSSETAFCSIVDGEGQRSLDGTFDLGNTAWDIVNLALSGNQGRERRVADCTYRVEKLMRAIETI